MSAPGAPATASRRECPKCSSSTMAPVIHRGVGIDLCSRCGGVFLDGGELQKILGDAPAEWGAIDALRAQRVARGCPACGARFNSREYGRGSGIHLDHCGRCGGIFLDRDEVRLLRFEGLRAARKSETLEELPGTGARLFSFFTGLPIEIHNPRGRPPVMVIVLLLVNAAVFLLTLREWKHGHDVFPAYGIVPAVALQADQAYRFLTAMFLHGGILHLVANLYFLWVFGDNVEDRFGHVGFLILYLFWGVAAGVADAALDPSSVQPRVGASGAISGVLGAYIVLRPRATLFFWVLIFPVRVRAVAYILVWAAIQVVFAGMHFPGVAWWAHASGFAAGVLSAALLRTSKLVTALPN